MTPPMAHAVTRATIMQLTVIKQRSEPTNETKATIQTQIGKSHNFPQVTSITSNGTLLVETNALLDCDSDNFVKKG